MGLLYFLVVLYIVSTTSKVELSRSETLAIIHNSSTPIGIPSDFECGWRSLAYEYALRLQSFRSNASFIALHDALQLTTLCNLTSLLLNSTLKSTSIKTDTVTSKTSTSSLTVLYVDAAYGNDKNDGSESSPLEHLASAVIRGRTLSGPISIILRGGAIHRLTETLQLGPYDNGLQIIAYPGETPVISSGFLLNTTWKSSTNEQMYKKKDFDNCTWQVLVGENAMYNDWPSPFIINATAANNANECQTACSTTLNCTSFIFYDINGPFGPEWNGRCFFRTDNEWILKSESFITSGRCIPPSPLLNVYSSNLETSGTPLPTLLTSQENLVLTILISTTPGEGTGGYIRAIRSRYPNCDPELCLWPSGWLSDGVWLPPKKDMNTTITHVPFPFNYGPGMFSDYWIGSGGPCIVLKDGDGPISNGSGANSSYWCQPNGRVSGGLYFLRQPIGLTVSSLQLINTPYKNASANGAILHYWRPSHWYSSFVRIASATTDPTTNNTDFTWTYGAFHGAEGSDIGEDFYLDHIKEELDSAREFYFEAETQTLYYVHNATFGTPPPDTWLFEVPMLHCLINISGENETLLVENITFDGLVFIGSSASFLQNHGISAGGDWSIARIGAITAENTKGISIINSTFTRLDGNAIVLNGFNRDVLIDSNEFYMIGESAVVSWGRVNGADARNGTQPFGTIMTRNLCHEIGIYEKQVSCYFATLTGNATIMDNIFFNVPRAAINFNDDMAGGSLVARNLVFNTCRESQE
jgi:hypothetical protein